MKSYKETEIYKLAFDLAVRVYIINMTLPRNELIKEGNILRRTSVGIKDTIAESYSSGINSSDFSKSLSQASISCDETIKLLMKIKKIHFRELTINEIIRNYISLKNKIIQEIEFTEMHSNLIPVYNEENQLHEQKVLTY
jgi:four helix bundle protein